MASMDQLMEGVKFYITQSFQVKNEFAHKGVTDNAIIEQALKQKLSETHSYTENELNIIVASSKNILEDKNKSFIVHAIIDEYITPQALEPIISEIIVARLPDALQIWHKSFTGSSGGGKKTKKRNGKSNAKKTRKTRKTIRRYSKRKTRSKTYKK
jgi:hypothetical protein